MKVLKSITISLHLSAFSSICLDQDQSSMAVTACCTSPREPQGMVWEIVISSTYFHMSVNFEIVDHKQEKPRAKLGPLRNPGGD